MPKLTYPFLLASTLALSLVLGAPGQAADTEEAEPEEESFAIGTANCGDVYDLFEDATPGEGKDPEALARAQDDVLYFVIWVHGYLSGIHGIDQKKRPLNEQGIKNVVAEIDEVCEGNESKPFLEVARSIE